MLSDKKGIYVDVEYTRGNVGDTSQHERVNSTIRMC